MISNNQQDKPPGQRWRERAACREIGDPELFFPTAESGPARTAQIAAAKAVCARCRVRAECLAEALVRIPYGICGGLTEHERRTLRRTASHTSAAASVSVSVDGLPGEAMRPGLTARTTARERAQVGRALLAAGRTAGQVARACGVSARTVQRWATPTAIGLSSIASTGSDTEEGSTAATGLPSGSSQHTTPRQAHEHRKDNEPR